MTRSPHSSGSGSGGGAPGAAAFTAALARARRSVPIMAAVLVCLLALTAHLLLLPVDAKDLAATARAAETAAMASNGSSSDAADKQVEVEAWYKAQFSENEAQLVGFPSSELQGLLPTNTRPCLDRPSVQMRSSSVAPNPGCPSFFTSLGASCTCLDGQLASPESWELKVRAKSGTKAQPTTQKLTDTLEVNAISTLWVNKTLTTLYV